jgi:hypothetical protein
MDNEVRGPRPRGEQPSAFTGSSRPTCQIVANFQNEIRRPRRQSKMIYLTQEQNLFVKAQFDAVIARLELVLCQYPTSLTGDHVLATTTSKQYDCIFDSLSLFLKRIGDFESLLILNNRAPLKFCPSLSADSLIAYIDYKILPEGTPIAISADSASNPDRIGPIKDIFTDRPLLATQTWKCPGAVNQFLSALSTLHKSRNQGGQYCEPCDDCIAQYAINQKPCRFHADYPRLWRCGSPRSLNNVKNRYQRVTKVELAGYVAQGNSPLLPHVLIELRTSLLSKNSIENLRLWVMILFHIQLFLRAAEGCSFRFDHFVQGLTSLNTQTRQIVALGIQVFGKSDDNPELLMIWRNDKVPEICLIRHLLVWIHLSKNTSGFLFPDHTGRSCIDYESFQTRLISDFCFLRSVSKI